MELITHPPAPDTRRGLNNKKKENTMKKTLTIKHTGAGGDVRVAIDNARNMARDAADILARREFGRRGTVVALRLDSWSEDGRAHTYEAFIGRAPTASEALKYGYGVTGHNVWIYV